MRRSYVIGAMLAAFLLAFDGEFSSGAARADQTDPRLHDLFSQLQMASSPTKASELEARIWSIWAEAGNPDIDKVYEIGTKALALGDLTTALKIFDTIVTKAPNFAEGWNKRATIYFMMDRYEESLADIDRTLELEPHHFGALSGLGLVNIKLDRDEAALDAFERVLKVSPQSQSAKANIEFVKQRIKDKSI